MRKVVFLGLGNMGYHMAGHIVKNGRFFCGGWNRNKQKLDKWHNEFKRGVYNLNSEISKADIIISCIGNNNDLKELTTKFLNKLQKGSIWIDHTTTSYEAAKETELILKKNSVHFLDAPVSGGEIGAINGALSCMIGGNAKILEDVQDLMECYCNNISHIGDIGYGQLTKMVNQIAICGVLSGLSEAINFIKAENLDIDKVLDAISNGAAGSWQMSNRAKSMYEDKFNFGFAMDLMIKDLKYATQRAKKSGVNTNLANQVLDKYKSLSKDGFGSLDTSALIKYNKG